MFSHQSMIVLLTALYTELSWGLPTSLFILLCHSVTAWSISSSYVSSKRGLKYLSYDLKYPHTRFFIWPYEHQSYSYSPRPRTVLFGLGESTVFLSNTITGYVEIVFEVISYPIQSSQQLIDIKKVQPNNPVPSHS